MTDPIACQPKEAAQLIGVSRTKIFELLAANKVQSIKIGRRRLVKVSSLRAFIDQAA